MPLVAGPPPTSVTAEQTGLSQVLIMWTAPSPPPTDGYHVLITRGSTTTTANVIGTSYTISVNNQYGMYNIQVIALSQSLPSEATEPVEITVIGNNIALVSTCGNSTACCLVTKAGSPLLYLASLLPPPPQHTPGGSLFSMLTTQNTLINMKEATN